MVPTHTTKNGNKRYRYYVCAGAQSRGWHTCPSPSVPAPELERYVVEQIKSIGKDPGLLADTLEEGQRESEEAIKRLETERRALQRGLNRDGRELRELAARAGRDALATDRMADLQDRIREAEQRATEVRERIIAVSRELVSAEEVAAACSGFEPLWDTLAAREQARILHLLIERVDYDGPGGTVFITFHPTGIKTLAEELSLQEVTA
jgi:site-specific DNA recombinase